MRKTSGWTLILNSLLLLATLTLPALPSCGDGGLAGVLPPGGAGSAGGMTLSGATVASDSGFTLRLLDASNQYGGAADYSIAVQPDGDGMQVTIRAVARELRCALLELRYDARRRHPLDCQPGSWPGRAELVNLAVLDMPGRVYYGAVLPRPQEAAGVSGEFELLKVRFGAGASDVARSASDAPMDDRSQISDLAIDLPATQVSFHYFNCGDYDQNSEVNIADLTQLGIHYGDSSGGGTFPVDTAHSVVDGDGNGEINIADITPIGVTFGCLIQSFNLYGGASADYPADAFDDNGAAQLVASLPVPGPGGNWTHDPGTIRSVYSGVVTELSGTAAQNFWLRPLSHNGEGIASNMVTAALPGDTTPPVWTNDPGGVGVVNVVSLDGAARVMWGEATDADSPPVTYDIYYSEGASVDFGSATKIERPVSLPPDPAVDQQYEVTGLTNGTQYAFAVRARDSADPSNEDTNTVALTVTPQTVEELPATITEAMVFDGPVVLSSGNTCDASTSECVTFLGDLRIEGTLNGLAHDLWLNIKGDLYVSGQIIHVQPDVDPPPADGNAGSLKLTVRGDAEFTETSVASSNGNFYLVDSEEGVISPDDAADDVDVGDLGLFPFAIAPEDPHGTSAVTSAVTQMRKQASQIEYFGPPSYWLVRGDWGKVPTPPRGTERIIYRIYPVGGYLVFDNFSIEASKGRNGKDAIGGCSPVGGNGQDCPFRLRMHAGRNITYQNVTIKLGDGGDGGNAVTDADCDPGVAKGGKGGKPNNRFLFTAGESMTVLGSFNLNPGNGGKGGDATAFGEDKDPGCVAESGGDAIAFGGEGGEVPRWGLRMQGNITGGASVNLGKATGGKGGEAVADAGDGGADTCCPGAKGGDGGTGSSTAGRGGDSTFTDGGSPASGGGAEGGDGGAATSYGGDGGSGASCGKLPGGDGGDGGYAISTAGDGGTAKGAGPSTNGDQGAANAIAGDGGDGGDGWGPGIGGKGGLASATGNPATTEDGDDGEDGEWDFSAFSTHQIRSVDIPDPDPATPVTPLPPGLYPLPIYDMGQPGEPVVGNLTLELQALEPGAGFELINWNEAGHAGGPTVLRMMGRCLLRIDHAKAVYGAGDSPPWIGLNYSQYYTVCDFSSDFVRGQFNFDLTPLNDFVIPGNDMFTPVTNTFYVEPTGGQWDVCDITCGASCITEIIEITIIDP